MQDYAVHNMSRLLIKAGEHTWGLAIQVRVMDDFRSVLLTAAYFLYCLLLLLPTSSTACSCCCLLQLDACSRWGLLLPAPATACYCLMPASATACYCLMPAPATASYSTAGSCCGLLLPAACSHYCLLLLPLLPSGNGRLGPLEQR